MNTFTVMLILNCKYLIFFRVSKDLLQGQLSTYLSQIPIDGEHRKLQHSIIRNQLHIKMNFRTAYEPYSYNVFM